MSTPTAAGRTMVPESLPSPAEMSFDPSTVGAEMLALATDLFPICRSITGDGVRMTLARLQREIPLTLTEVPSGTSVFDWTVPKEWNIRDAWIKDTSGKRVVDFRQNNLHVVNYSVPVRRTLPLQELKRSLFALADKPDAIPYRTSYYQETWGFCLSWHQLDQLQDGDYEVCIDSRLEAGSLTFGECFLPGQIADEVLISCHVCHPSLANDNLSGISLAVALAKRLREESRRYSYRFLFIPGTIGSITWLALNEDKTVNIKHGLVLTCVGDSGPITYKRSRRGNAEIDRAVEHVLKSADRTHCVIDFHPYGYDERQYCSPGFNLPVGCLMRSQHGKFPEYHTSADNLSFIQPQYLGDSFVKAWAVIQLLEKNRTYVNQNPKCEPRLGKRGLYSGVGGAREGAFSELALLWVLNLSDGEHDLLAIAERSCMSFGEISSAASALQCCGLLEERPA
jgi:aminopeptidase-like protein